MAVILLLLFSWVVVTAIGAGEAADAETWLDLPSFDWLAYVVMALMILTVVVVFVSAIMFRSENKEAKQRKRRPMWPLLIMLLVFFALSQREPGETDPDDVRISTAEAAQDESDPGPTVVGPGRGETAALAFIVLAAAALLLWARRGNEDPQPEELVPLDEALTPAIRRATEHLTLGDDPRSAVLLAYDGLEAALSARGLPRGRSETPSEHLQRVLVNLAPDGSIAGPVDGSNPDSAEHAGSDQAEGTGPDQAERVSAAGRLDTGPLLRLAELYEVARFSEQPITVAQQNEAAQSLRRVQERMTAI